MKHKISTWIAAITFVGAVTAGSALAAPTPASSHKTVEVTGCLQQGPAAKEYIVQGNDGTTWGVTSADRNMYMNDYVGQTVTIAGDTMHPNASLRAENQHSSPAINHYVKAMDVAVDSESCSK